MSGFVLTIGRPDQAPPWLSRLRLEPGAGWARQALGDDVDVFTQPGPTRCAVLAGGPDLLLGDVQVDGRHQPQGLLHPAWDGPKEQALVMTRRAWGDYVHVRLPKDGRPLSIFRAPSGGLEAVTWLHDGVRLVASTFPDWFEAALPKAMAVDWRQVAGVLGNPTQHTGEVCLTDLQTISPGGLWVEGALHQVWTPAAFVERRRNRVDWAPDLLATVDQVVKPWSHARILLEISGGLDSAIVGSALAACGGEITCGLNYYGGDPQGDERPYARAVAQRLGVSLTEAPKAPQPLDMAALAVCSGDFRPALNSFDHIHDDHVAALCRALDVEVILTGQGGDNVFFQTPTPWIAADHLARASVSELADLARWQGQSIWSLYAAAWRARWDRPAPKSRPDVLTEKARGLAAQAAPHPWLCDLDQVGPAKRLQIESLANALIVHGSSRRGAAARLQHPLLAQPLLELCLAIPALDLTAGGIDRGLARRTFAHRIPKEVAQRRTKGRLSAHYGQIIAQSLPVLRPMLLEGRLVAEGLVQADRLEEWLSVDHLIWRGGYGVLVNLIMTELWVTAWERRLQLPR
ncbi:asparagine synthase-related protein [Phenylobacterium sp.]|uniref:asparagine synthase-related protein n=1 Tax=Phenylobacterium sp. TaxID=1871053 RepID=UPI003521B288